MNHFVWESSLIDRLESGLQKSSRECVSLVVGTKECLMTRAYGQFLRTAGPHFPASQRHNKRTVKFQAIKSYAAKGALHE